MIILSSSLPSHSFSPAAHLAQTEATPALHAVIVENTFTSIADMAKRLFQVFLLDYIPVWCYKNVVGGIESRSDDLPNASI